MDLILGISEKFNLNNYLLNYRASYVKKIHRCEINNNQLFYPTDSVEERTRAYVKIQDGCDYKCSFCTIPIARGRSRSDSIQSVLNRVNLILKALKINLLYLEIIPQAEVLIIRQKIMEWMVL